MLCTRRVSSFRNLPKGSISNYSYNIIFVHLKLTIIMNFLDSKEYEDDDAISLFSIEDDDKGLFM